MSVSWEFFVKRGKININNFLLKNNIKNYENLCNFLKKVSVIPPKKGTLSFLTNEIKEKDTVFKDNSFVSIKESSTKKKTIKKKTIKKKTIKKKTIKK